jgi:hypothetical protein
MMAADSLELLKVGDGERYGRAESTNVQIAGIFSRIQHWRLNNMSQGVQGSIKLPFNVDRITWTAKVGKKGLFELSDDYESPDHKLLLSFLQEYAGGALSSQGFFYWVFVDGVSIGRKPSNQVRCLR